MQLGAFLLVLRYRGETAAELAGFVRAARAQLVATARSARRPRLAVLRRQPQAAALFPPRGPAARPQWLPGPAARRRRRGRGGHAARARRARASRRRARPPRRRRTARRHELRLPAARGAAAGAWPSCSTLKPVLGVRTFANTVARELNPFRAPCQIQGVFHPPYLELHRATQRLLGQRRGGDLQGRRRRGAAQSGEALPGARAAAAGETLWPALTPGAGYPWRDEPLDADRLAALWTGEAA